MKVICNKAVGCSSPTCGHIDEHETYNGCHQLIHCCYLRPTVKCIPVEAEDERLKKELDTSLQIAGTTYMAFHAQKKLCKKLAEALKEAELQIKYLQQKFAITSTGETVLSHIQQILAGYEKEKK